jgi:serine/threonine protein kinase
MNSPNILKLHDYYFTSNNTYIITEYCNQGDLATILKKCGNIPEVEALKILKHITNGFKEQIKKGIIHRDIKPANIFLKNGIPKIADYGFSKMANAPKDKIYYNVGTPLYMCPSTIKNNNYSEKTDIWSIGILYYELLYG